jgi:AcrR family transcriptional regulator
MSESTRAGRALIDAGAELLLEPQAWLPRVFRAGDVSRRAGLARRTFYDHFETVEQYAEAVRRALVDEEERPPSAPANRGDDVSSAARDVVVDALAAFRSPRRRAASMLRVASPPSDGSSTAESAWLALMNELEAAGRDFRPSFTREGTAAILDAVVSSAALRGVEDVDSIATVALGVLATVTVPRDDPAADGVDDTFAAAVAIGWRERDGQPLVVHVRELVLDVALEEIDRRGIHHISLATVAERAGLSQTAITRYVGGIGEIFDALTERVNPGFDVALQADRAHELPGEEILLRHFERVVTVLRDRRGYAAAELAVRRDPPSDRSTSRRHLDAAVTSLVAQARSRRTGQELVQLAGIAHQLACSFALDTSCPPARVASFVNSLLLHD